MIKKGRDLKVSNVVDLRGSNKLIQDKIAGVTNTSIIDKVALKQYQILPKYGEGYITNINTENIDITISQYQLRSDLVFYQSSKKEIIQISFLLKGEKIIQIDGNKEVFYENRESYMAHIKSFNGCVRILGEKLFKEVKIKLPASFLIDHGFMNNYELMELSDENLILPITDELFSILDSMERKDITGNTNAIYLKAKVLEIMAVQMDNYKNKEVNILKLNGDKTLKKLYLIKQVIKSNLHKNFSLMQLASEVGINGSTLNKEYIRIFGCSVHEFSISEKMIHARYMLESTQKMIYQIAEEVGYKNATHFTAAFKRRYGETPKEVRRHL